MPHEYSVIFLHPRCDLVLFGGCLHLWWVEIFHSPFFFLGAVPCFNVQELKMLCNSPKGLLI